MMYHLLPLARHFGMAGHRNKIGFFHHVPFPPTRASDGTSDHHEHLIPAMGAFAFLRDGRESLAGRVMMHWRRSPGFIPKASRLRMEPSIAFSRPIPIGEEEVTYLQITPKSRSEIREYADMERQSTKQQGASMGNMVRRPGRRSVM